MRENDQLRVKYPIYSHSHSGSWQYSQQHCDVMMYIRLTIFTDEVLNGWIMLYW